MKILTVCPTIYPKKLKSMSRSWITTASKYSDILCQSTDTVTEAINQIFHDNPDYDFYFIVNDDCIFETPLWDMELAIKNKISYGRDNIQNENLCTFPMIDGNIVRALGWLQMPLLTRYCGDLVWKLIGQECKCLNYNPSVMIRHKWSESQVDSNIHKQDQVEFAKWLMVSYRDVNKVNGIING